MCVICVKPAGRRLPEDHELRAMYEANPDGCGFATANRFFKSLDFEEFLTEIHKVNISEPCIIHFRWATHGSVNVKNCHPFYDQESNTYFAHNGILGIRPVGDMTDSETAFRTALAPCIRDYGISSRVFKTEVGRIIGYSKFAFIQDGRVYTFGHFERLDGLLYSNLRWFGMVSGWY